MAKFFLFGILLFSTSVFATPIGVRYNYLTTESLPAKLWTYGVSTGEMTGSGSKTYDDTGKLISNKNYYSTSLNFGDISEQIQDNQERALALAAFEVYGKNLNESVGRVENDVKINVKSTTYIIGRGLTENTDLFLIFPTVNIQTSFTSKFIASDSLNSLVKKLKSEGQNSRANEIINNSRNGLYKNLSENGYKTEYPGDVTSLANIYVNFRYKAYDTGKTKLLSDSFVIIPSGETFDDNQFLDLRVNEEQYSIKQGLTLSRDLGKSIKTLVSTSYQKRFAFEKTKRIPKSDTNRFTNDKDKNTTVQYGDTFSFSAQLNYKFNPVFSYYLGQSFTKRYADSYTGKEYSSSRYELLEKDTDQELGEFYTGITIDTVDSFLKKKFIIPLNLNIQYAQSNFGINALDSQVVSFNLIGFYQ